MVGETNCGLKFRNQVLNGLMYAFSNLFYGFRCKLIDSLLFHNVSIFNQSMDNFRPSVCLISHHNLITNDEIMSNLACRFDCYVENGLILIYDFETLQTTENTSFYKNFGLPKLLNFRYFGLLIKKYVPYFIPLVFEETVK